MKVEVDKQSNNTGGYFEKKIIILVVDSESNITVMKNEEGKMECTKAGLTQILV